MTLIKQIITLMIMRKRSETAFYHLNENVYKIIYDYVINDPKALNEALKHAANARTEDVKALLALLDENPFLLLQSGNVKTPGGLTLKGVLIYELLLGATDFDLASQVAEYFKRIPYGQQERNRQYARYSPHLDGIFNSQNSYNITPILNLLRDEENNESVRNDIEALIAKTPGYHCKLGDEIAKFKAFHSPDRPLTQPRIHFNYSSMLLLYQLLCTETMMNELYLANGSNWRMYNFIWINTVGYMQSLYPSIDRFILARGMDFYAYQDEESDDVNPLIRQDNIRHQGRDLPMPSFGQAAERGAGVLGEDFAISENKTTKSHESPMLDNCTYGAYIGYKVNKMNQLRLFQEAQCLNPLMQNVSQRPTLKK